MNMLPQAVLLLLLLLLCHFSIFYYMSHFYKLPFLISFVVEEKSRSFFLKFYVMFILMYGRESALVSQVYDNEGRNP